MDIRQEFRLLLHLSFYFDLTWMISESLPLEYERYRKYYPVLFPSKQGHHNKLLCLITSSFNCLYLFWSELASLLTIITLFTFFNRRFLIFDKGIIYVPIRIVILFIFISRTSTFLVNVLKTNEVFLFL